MSPLLLLFTSSVSNKRCVKVQGFPNFVSIIANIPNSMGNAGRFGHGIKHKYLDAK